MNDRLIFGDGSIFEGMSVGAACSAAGEVVFTTGMVGYPESLTDPSYKGQILIFTYPLIGNYGVPRKEFWESDRIHVSGVIVSSYIENNTHPASIQTLRDWLIAEKIPALEIKDTRALTQKLREQGAMPGKMIIGEDINWHDPNAHNVVADVSVKEIKKFKIQSASWRTKFQKNSKFQTLNSKFRIVLIDCGVKQNIIRSLVNRGADVTIVPWDFDVLSLNERFDGVVISNGPGDPKMVTRTVANVRKLLARGIPTLGICLGNQILTLAAGGDTYKLKFGHRSQNQPVSCSTHAGRHFLTTQNHGFSVNKIPKGFTEWFTNTNDGTNEGLLHKTKPFMSVQFHPEATPGPTDTNWIFDEFLSHITHNT